MVRSFWVQTSKSLVQNCKNRFWAYFHEKCIDLRKSKTRMVLIWYHEIDLTPEMCNICDICLFLAYWRRQVAGTQRQCRRRRRLSNVLWVWVDCRADVATSPVCLVKRWMVMTLTWWRPGQIQLCTQWSACVQMFISYFAVYFPVSMVAVQSVVWMTGVYSGLSCSSSVVSRSCEIGLIHFLAKWHERLLN